MIREDAERRRQQRRRERMRAIQLERTEWLLQAASWKELAIFTVSLLAIGVPLSWILAVASDRLSTGQNLLLCLVGTVIGVAVTRAAFSMQVHSVLSQIDAGKNRADGKSYDWSWFDKMEHGVVKFSGRPLRVDRGPIVGSVAWLVLLPVTGELLKPLALPILVGLGSLGQSLLRPAK